MERCKNCKYFKRHTGKNDNKKYGKCNCEKFNYGDALDDKDNLNDNLFYMDYEWYNADIEVGENFGCVHFKREE
jgi:hypothetical protein